MITNRLRRLAGTGRVLVAVGIGAAVFGIATAVQASIPDSNQIVHSCYNTSLAHGSPIGAMRAIDTDKAGGVCASWEGAVDLATPQYVQNVVTSTINQTSFVLSASGALSPGQWVFSYFCPSGYVATDPAVGGNDLSFGSNDNLTVHSLYNDGVETGGAPGGEGQLFFQVANATTNVTAHGTCVDGRVFGQAGPLVPLATAETLASASFRQQP
jgi:hypothetical protein